MSTPRKDNTPLTTILKSHGITYNSILLHGSESLPAHVNIVREGLLDFDGFLNQEVTHKQLEHTSHKYSDIPKYAYRYDENSDPGILGKFIETAVTMSNGAQRLRDAKAAEAEWQDLFKKTVIMERVFKQTVSTQTTFKQRKDCLSNEYQKYDSSSR